MMINYSLHWTRFLLPNSSSYDTQTPDTEWAGLDWWHVYAELRSGKCAIFNVMHPDHFKTLSGADILTNLLHEWAGVTSPSRLQPRTHCTDCHSGVSDGILKAQFLYLDVIVCKSHHNELVGTRFKIVNSLQNCCSAAKSISHFELHFSTLH